MNRTRHTQRRASAFTLMEVLIAVAVFAIVLLAINAVFYGTLRLYNTATGALEEAVPVQQAAAIIRKDLVNIMRPGGTLSGTLQTPVIGTGTLAGQVGPDLYTSTGIIHDNLPWGEVQKVSYLLIDSQDRSGGKDLVRAVTRNLLPVAIDNQPPQQWLMGGVKDVTFLFYDGNEWLDTWDSTQNTTTTGTTMPLAIKVQITRVSAQNGRAQPAPMDITVRLAVSSGGTQTQQTTGGQQ